MASFSQLSANWFKWTGLARLANVSVSMDCDDCQIMFHSSDYEFHLRNTGTWWIIDTVDDRGHRHNDTAQLSTFELAEKYLIWEWGSMARSIIGVERLGTRLYSLGYSPDVEVILISEGIAELRSTDGSAILMEPYATIFSHLISKSIDEIERMVTDGIA
jgi:hypothetical protein